MDKSLTIDVPEERVAEFYAFFGHFLAGERRRGRGPRGRHRHDHHHHCGPHRHGHAADEAPLTAEPTPRAAEA